MKRERIKILVLTTELSRFLVVGSLKSNRLLFFRWPRVVRQAVQATEDQARVHAGRRRPRTRHALRQRFQPDDHLQVSSNNIRRGCELHKKSRKSVGEELLNFTHFTKKLGAARWLSLSHAVAQMKIFECYIMQMKCNLFMQYSTTYSPRAPLTEKALPIQSRINS